MSMAERGSLLPRRKRRAWSSEERVVLDHFVQAIKNGKYDALARATRACLDELAKVRAPVAAARDRWTVYGYLQRRTIRDSHLLRSDVKARHGDG